MRRLIGAAVGRPGAAALVLLLVTAVLGVGLGQLSFETGQDSLIDRGSEVARDNRRYQESFGGDTVVVAWTGAVDDVFTAENLGELLALEQDLRDTRLFSSVLGPATALDWARRQLPVLPPLLLQAADRAAAATPAGAARDRMRAERVAALGAEAAALTAAGDAELENPAFARFLALDPAGEIRPSMRDNFPDERHLVMVVHLLGNADIESQGDAAGAVRRIVSEHPLQGFEVVVAGTPTLLAEIDEYLQGGMATLGAIAAGVMVVLLLLLFRARARLLPLAVVALGLVWAFGAAGYAGVRLSLVTISGLPILLGLGVDVAIQLHSRYEEERGGGAGVDQAAATAVGRMGRPLLVAMVAAVAGFAALRISRVPMIRDFGVLLGLGTVALVAAALGCTLVAVTWLDRRRRGESPGTGGRLERLVVRLTSVRPQLAVPLLVLVAVVAVAGMAVEGDAPIETDPEQWVDPGSQTVADLDRLEEEAGFTSEISLLVEAEDVTAPDVVAWMQEVAAEVRAAHADAVVAAVSAPGVAAAVLGTEATAADVQTLLGTATDEVRRVFVNDQRTQASLVFPVAPISLADRERLLEELTASLDPPPGVRATPAGLAVVGVELVDALEANRREMTLLALALVAVWLLVAFRRPKRALLALAPVLFAVGASALLLRLFDIALTPLTTVAGPLAIAVTTEFSVLVLARYLEERGRGLGPAEAVAVGSARIGRAFVASGLTLIGGFAVLVLSPMPLLADFGAVVTVIGLVALAGCLVILPPLLERWGD